MGRGYGALGSPLGKTLGDGSLFPVWPVIQCVEFGQTVTGSAAPRTNYAKATCSVLDFGGTGVAPVVTANAGIAPDGTNTAWRLQLNKGAGTSGADMCRASFGAASGSPAGLQGALWIRARSGTPTVAIEIGSGINRNVTLSSSWQRFASQARSDQAFGLLVSLRGVYGTDDSADIEAWGPMLIPPSVAQYTIPPLSDFGLRIPPSDSGATQTDYTYNPSTGICTFATSASGVTIDGQSTTGSGSQWQASKLINP